MPGGRGPIFAVADGLGGHAAGEIASRVAVEATVSTWTSSSLSNPTKALQSAARAANAAVVNESLRAGQAGMGTTLTALTLTPTEVVIAHVGDSRAYRVRADSCVQLTADHSRVGEMLRMKLITVEQAARHPARSQLTRSLGAGPLIQIDLVRERLAIGDTFILCTDGLWDEVSNAELAGLVAAFRDEHSQRETARRLVGIAIERGSADNVTAVVVKVTSALPAAPSTDKWSLFRKRS
jgi:serine/threonine protein phosphatase PrpC